jgi:predicted metalloprotease with PDZ domain
MRGVDLTVFDFDYDLTWAAFFMNAGQKIYGRYGGRDAGPAEQWLSLAGLKYAMKKALDAHLQEPAAKGLPLVKVIAQVEKYPAAAKVKKNNCIHCHEVYDFHRDWLTSQGKWSQEELWVYPPPANIGLTMSANQGDKVEYVGATSPAAQAGLKPGDLLVKVNGVPIASYGDLQYALHLAPKQGSIDASWKQKGKLLASKIELMAGWRQSDISWRGSMWGVEPKAHVYGRDLTVAEKGNLGLGPKQLAFSQGSYVPPPAYQAGIRANDIIIGADGKKLEMTMLQFNVWVRLNYKSGDMIVYNILRDSKKLNIPMLLKAGN